MKLVTFRVTNFRSINDSGPITAARVTTLVGRNESGKTNLLLALRSLNPPGGPKELSAIKDFPRSRRMSECTPDTTVLSTIWELSAAEQVELAAMFPRAKGLTQVEIGRYYKDGTRWVGFPGIKPIQFNHRDAASKFQKLKSEAAKVAERMESGPKATLEAAIAAAEPAISEKRDPDDWAATAKPALKALRKALTSTGAELALEQPATELDEIAEAIEMDDKAHIKARNWAVSRLPVFVYVDEYPELQGHQNIDEYLQRKAANGPTEADRNFEKLCKVADLNPQQLKDLLAKGDHETRSQLANRAGAVVTGEIRRLWKDRALKIRFNPDAAHLTR